jgi:hypothetical protein
MTWAEIRSIRKVLFLKREPEVLESVDRCETPAVICMSHP